MSTPEAHVGMWGKNKNEKIDCQHYWEGIILEGEIRVEIVKKCLLFKYVLFGFCLFGKDFNLFA